MNDYDIKKIYEEMELHLIRSMKRNLGRHLKEEIATGMEWKMWQVEKLKELKRYQRQNKDIIGAYTKGLDKDVADILKEEFKQGFKSEINKFNKLFDKNVSDSFFKLNDRKANALIKVVNDDLEKANIAALRMMNDVYRQTIHKAATFASNGVMTQKQAVDMATRDFLSRGLAVIEYADGKRVNIASYSQMAVRTASQRAMLMGEGEFRKEIGETLVIISKHGTACKLCQPHESQVYIDDVYSGGKPDGKHKLLSEAMDQGLFHPNCRHGVSTYYGLDEEEEQQETTVNVPKENNNEDAARLDREIQKEKRKVTGFQSPDNLKTAQQRMKELEAQKQEITRGYKQGKYTHEKANEMDLWNKVKKNSDKYKDLLPTGDTARKLTEDDGTPRIGDLMLKEIAKEQGFDGLPKVVSSSEMDKLIKDGAEPIYRGLQSIKYCDDFINGEYYTGLGMYGNGNYFVGNTTRQLDKTTRQFKTYDGLELATAYAGNNEKGGIVRAVIDPNAKIIDYNIIDNADSGIYYNDKSINKILDGEVNQYGMVTSPTDTDRVIQKILTSDEGRWAAYAGYDVIYVPGLNYYCVLNRTAVIVDESIITLKEEGEKINAIIGNGTKRTFAKQQD